MSDQCTIPVPGSDSAARARALAGALAEAGVTRLTWREPGQPGRTVAARSTDLPGLLAAGEGVLEDAAGRIRAVVSRREIIVTTTIAAVVDSMARAGQNA